MTPTEIETMARQQYNSVGDTFFSSSEIMSYIYMAEMELCKYTNMLKDTFETTSVAGQKEYPFPETTISIKRLTFDGNKVTPTDFREDDDNEAFNAITTTADQPAFYYQWGSSFFLTPTPKDDGKEIKAYVYKRPQPVTITSTIEVDVIYHLDIVNFVTWKMSLKDENPVAAREYQNMWITALQDARKLERRRLRGDSFASVKDVDNLAVTRFGIT